MELATPAPPSAKLVRDVLGELARVDVDVSTGQPVVLNQVTRAFTGVYTRQLRTAGLVLLDVPLAAILGGAVATLPAEVVRETLSSGQMPAAITLGIRTALEAASAWFGGTAPLALYQVVTPHQTAPPDVRVLSSALVRRRDLAVRVPGYGAGRLSVVLAP